MNQLIHHFNRYISEQKLFSRNHRILVGVSGGLDSVVLCQLLKANGYAFEMAHVNFQLRGPESDRDEDFVKDMARELDVPCHTIKFDTSYQAAIEKQSIQVVAREFRYHWFEKLLNERQGATDQLHFVATAHHANDNAETILINLFRGTGIAGLRGILPAREKIRRPLLFAQREQLQEFAAEIGLKWVEDSSNALLKYTRNFIRHSVIPQISSQFPGLVSTLNDSAAHLRETELFLQDAMDNCLKKILVIKGQEQQIPVERWRKLPGAGAVLFAWIKNYGFTAAQLEDAKSLGESQTGHYIDSNTHRLLRNRNWLVLTPKEEKASGLLLLEQNSGSLNFGGGQLCWETTGFGKETIPNDKGIAWLDAARIAFPLILRPWKAGDYFYPLGMAKKKKLARFLMDSKLSRIEKDQVWVLESDRKIIWVIGLRMDDRYKVKPSTETVLKIQINTLPG